MSDSNETRTPEADASGGEAESGEAGSGEAAGLVVFLSGDLMFASRVRGAAENAGLEFKLSGRLPDDPGLSIRYVILDLATMSKLTGELPKQCAGLCPEAVLIAYGPHVQVAKLDAAKEAGIESVLTRGQFDRMLPSLFQS